LSHRRRFDDIEGTKKYKGRQKKIPREGYGDKSYQLSGDFINDYKLWIFYSRTARDLRGGRNSYQSDQAR
jgi:hypothetical protein